MYCNSIKNILLIIIIITGLSSHAQVLEKDYNNLINEGYKKKNSKNYLQALELLTKAQDIAKKQNWPDKLFGATIKIGTCYRLMLDYGEALRYYLEAYNLAVKQKNKINEIEAISLIGVFYAEEHELKKAYDYFKRAYSISKEEKDSVNIGIYTLNLGMLMGEMKNYKQATAYFKESLLYTKKQPNFALAANGGIAEVEMELGHIEESKKIGLSLLAQFQCEYKSEEAISILLNLSKCYLKEKNFKEAGNYILLALKNNTDLNTKRNIYEMLSEIYEKSRFFSKALQYRDSVYVIQQKLNDIKNGRVYESNRVKFEVQDYKNQIAIKTAAIAEERKIFYAVIICITSLLLLVIFIYRTILMRHKQRKLIAENDRQLMALELARQESKALLQEKDYERKQHEIILEKEILKNEIEHKNRKLSSKALYTSGKYEIIQEVISLLSEQPEVAQIPAVKKHIRFLRNSINNDNSWANFLVHFEEVNQGFLTRLKAAHPNLSANDTKFICYVYMNLSAKEIASTLNITLDACRKRKERVSLKIGLKDSSSLFSYVSGI